MPRKLNVRDLTQLLYIGIGNYNLLYNNVALKNLKLKKLK